MNIKRELHTLHIKYDSQFKTLSKIALSQIVLKVIYLKSHGALYKQIKHEIENLLGGTISDKELQLAITLLSKDDKIRISGGRHYINEAFRKILDEGHKKTEALLDSILYKYFGKATSSKNAIKEWFQDSCIKFFEEFSYEWFYQVTYNKKKKTEGLTNIRELLADVLREAKEINNEDKVWLFYQYTRFLDSENHDDNLLFWQFGLSMFSSKLITARNFADAISIEMFRSSKFILDTNILMILDLEGHELHDSLKLLEKILTGLQITPLYFENTRTEYIRAMSARKTTTKDIFSNYTLEVLEQSDCPFITTALKRNCLHDKDIDVMFDQLIDIPKVFHESLPLKKYQYNELDTAISAAENDVELKEKLNSIYKQRFRENKREAPLIHDAGLIGGANFIAKTEKVWIITRDSTLKRYAIQNVIRDENEIAIGLDVILGILAINSGGIDGEASNFAPLFKNIIKHSLMPDSSTFELQDLAFILNSNLKVNELSDDKVIEAAKMIKKMRFAGEDEETMSLYLRRIIEGEKVELYKNIQEVKDREQLTLVQKDRTEKEREIFIESYRSKRRGELQDLYKRNLNSNRFNLLFIPIFVFALIFVAWKFWIPGYNNTTNQILISIAIEIVCGIAPLFPLNRRFVKRYSEYVTNIDETIEKEISEKKKSAGN